MQHVSGHDGKWTRRSFEQFGHKYVDVAAEVTIMADIVSEGKKSDFRGSHTIRIVSKDKPKPEAKI